MKIQTIGGAAQDIFMHYNGTEIMTLVKQQKHSSFMLFESGEKVEIDDVVYKTGGGATNSAVSFKRMGIASSCFCKVGNDPAGQDILQALNTELVDTKSIKVSPSHKTATSFIVNSLEGDYTIFAYRGANGFIEPDEIPWNDIKTASQLYITSLSHNSAQILPAIAEFAKKNQIPVAINPGISQLTKGTLKLKESLANIDTLILNSHEAKMFMFALTQSDQSYKKALECSTSTELCGLNMESEKAYLLQTPITYENMYFSLQNFFKEVLKMGPKIVAVTNGKNGVYAATRDEMLFHPSLKAKVINSVGAGDAFGSCFVASLMHGYDIATSLKHGIINSSSVLEHIGAKDGLLTHEALLAKAKRVPNLIQQLKPMPY